MLYRTLAILVVAFWLTMIGLLVRKESGAAGSALREVPVGHVMKLLLMHEQKSALQISSEKQRLGYLQIHPQMRKGERSRVIDFSGHVQVMIPGMERQRVKWDGELELEKSLATRRFVIRLTFSDPAQRPPLDHRVQITVEPPRNLLTWTLLGRDSLPDLPRTYTLDDDGMQKALREIDPALPQMIQTQTKSMSPPVIRAHQSSMLIHGQRLDTYLVSIEQSGQTLLEFDVSQLGEILRAKTLIGYSLAADNLMP